MIISQYEVLSFFIKDDIELVIELTTELQEGHCIFIITEDDGITFRDYAYYDKHKSDGQLLSGTLEDLYDLSNKTKKIDFEN